MDNLSLDIPHGDIFALLGPNGAGKTTTIELCEGFQKPDSGTLTVLGLDPTRDTDALRARIGIMLQGGGSYPGVRTKELLALLASYSANPLDVDWLLDTVGLTNHTRTPYRRLSGGQQQRLSLACALVGRPELVFLDEPTAGMDAQSRLAVWDLIASLKRDGVTVVLTTHLMDEAEALADRVAIIDQGQIVAAGTTEELTSQTDARITLATSGTLDIAAANTELNRHNMDIVSLRPHHYRLNGAATPDAIAHVTAAIAAQHILITQLNVDHRNLEDVFLDITGREMRD